MINVNIHNTEVHMRGTWVFIHAKFIDQDIETMYKIGRGQVNNGALEYSLDENTSLYLE